MLEARAVNAGYGRLQILSGVSITLNAGEVRCILGLNGAGKSTLLKTLVGQVRPSSGEVLLRGSSIARQSTDSIARAGIAYIPETHAALGRMTVRDNLLLGRVAARRRRADDLDEVWAMFPRLQERQTQLARTLSGGEQRMLVLGRALMAAPDAILLDEPSLGLAPRATEMFYEAIADIHQNRGTAILLVEQSVRFALEVSDWAYLLVNGRIAREGPASELAASRDFRQSFFEFEAAEAAC